MKNFRMWMLFVCAIVMIQIAGFFITGFLMYTGLSVGVLSIEQPIPWLPFLGYLIAASAFSVTVTVLISRFFFRPIHQLALAMDQVAEGNFQIQLPESAMGIGVREMNQNFNKMVKELNSMEMLQSDFIQNVSHEIKTPLAAIEGYASLLTAGLPPEEQQEYARRILESARRLSSLTGSILKLSKLENQQIISEKSWFSLDEQIRQVILTMEPLWSEKNLDLKLDLESIFYLGNEELMIQVWANLFSNAVKFTPKGGVISVRLKRTNQEDNRGKNDGIQAEFQDSGIGMSREVQAHIFDKFYQADCSRNGDGNGLGLALVKQIVGLCGGEIIVESKPDHGSTFIVRLPARENLLYQAGSIR